MRIVDAHVHLYPRLVNEAPEHWALENGENHWAILCTRKRRSGVAVQGFPSVDDLLRDMDEAGIERVILQGWYWENHDTCVRQNKFYRACIEEHPDRLSAFATFHPEAGLENVLRVVRWARESGFCGLGELSPHSQNVSAQDPVWEKVWVLAAELNLPVNLHVTEENSPLFPGKVHTPLGDFVKWAERHPATHFILAHWGARLPVDPLYGETIRRCRNVYFDTAASPLIYSTAVFREMVGAVGADRILYGSDHPLNMYPKVSDEARLGAMLRELAESGLGDDELQSVAAENALKLFGL